MEILGSIILSIVQSILFYGKEIGISMLLFEIICNGIIYYILNKKNKIQNKNGILLMIPIVLLSSTYFIFANTTFYIANIFVILVTNLIMYVILTNEKDYLKNYLYKTFELATNTIKEYKEGIKLTKRTSRKIITKNENINKENLKRVAISLLIVFVVVGIVLILLSSADMIFANLFSGIGNLFKDINIGTTFNIILRIAIIIIIYLLFLSLFLSIQKKNKKEERKIKESSGKYNFTIKLLLIVLNIVYLVFCFIQLQSLFAKINISNSFDYATYARTGFFQLMFVSFINFGLILISNRYYKKEEKIIRILNLLLVLFTIIIAVSAIYRMYMYETEFGLTYLRTFVYIALITEIIALVPIIAYIFNKKIDFIKWCLIVGISIYCIANYINIEKVIVSKNISRNNIRPIDYKYISNIVSEDSYEILEERLRKEEITGEEKVDILNILLNIASNTKDLSWQEFNISKYKLQKRKINIQELNKEIEKQKEKNKTILNSNKYNILYKKEINKNTIIRVKNLGEILAQRSVIDIEKSTDGGKTYTGQTEGGITIHNGAEFTFIDENIGFINDPGLAGTDGENKGFLVTTDGGKTFNDANIIHPDNIEEKNLLVKGVPYIEDGKLKLVIYTLNHSKSPERTYYEFISNDSGVTWEFYKKKENIERKL